MLEDLGNSESINATYGEDNEKIRLAVQEILGYRIDGFFLVCAGDAPADLTPIDKEGTVITTRIMEDWNGSPSPSQVIELIYQLIGISIDEDREDF